MTYKNIDVYTLIKPEILKLRNIGIETANLDCRLLLSETLGRYKTKPNLINAAKRTAANAVKYNKQLRNCR